MKILITEQHLKSIKNDIKRSLDEEVQGGRIIVYHRTRLTEENIKLLNSGFIPGNGAHYGRGLYATYDLNDQLRSNMKEYGDIIVEFSVSKQDKILCLNADECKKIYGVVLSVKDQLKKIMGGEYLKFIKKFNNKKELLDFIPTNGITGENAHNISETDEYQLYVDGMIFIGGNDGKVFVLYETNLANPLRYSTDSAKTWKTIKTKESYKIGRDFRGSSKLINYVRHKNISFEKLNDRDKNEIITYKVKSNIGLKESEYLYYINNLVKSEDELRKVQEVSIKEYPKIIQYIDNPSEPLQLAAVGRNPYSIEDIKNPSENVQIVAVKHRPNLIFHIIKRGIEPSEDVQLAAVEQEYDGISIFDIINKGIEPSNRVRIAAIKKDKKLVRYIDELGFEPSEDVQLAAVNKNNDSIRYIIIIGIEPSEDVQLVAVNKKAINIIYIKKPTEKVQLAAVKQDGNLIYYIIKNGIEPSEDVQLAAVEQEYNSIEHIKKPTPKVLNLYKELARKKGRNVFSVNEDVFNYNDLNDDEKNKLYDIFKKSYEKSTGTSWDKMKFNSRASNWTFYGVKDKGFVVVRKQRSGMNKLAGVAGDLKSISLGIDEINKLNEPVWGMADKRIVNLLTSKYDFYSPPAFVVKMLIKSIPSSVFGGVQYVVNKDGSLTFSYSDVGETTKYFFGNKKYYQQLLTQGGLSKIVKLFIKKIIG